MGCCCCHLCLSSYACGWAGWSNSIAQFCCLPFTIAFAFGRLCGQCGGFASRFNGGCNEGRADGFDCSNISEHPRNWCLRMHGARDLSVVISMRYVIAWGCLHPRNLLHVVNIVRGNGVIKNCRNSPVHEPVLHQWYIVSPVWLESSWHCLSFLGWL